MSDSSGALEGGCMAGDLQFKENGPALAAQAKTLLVSDGNQVWDVEYLIPGVTLPDLTGSMVDVTYDYSPGNFNPGRRRLSVVSESGPSVYQAEGRNIDQLFGLPVQLVPGAAVCSAESGCGNWRFYDLNASTGMTTTVIPFGASGQVGDYVVVHGGYAEPTSTNTSCSDWSVADVNVAVVRPE